MYWAVLERDPEGKFQQVVLKADKSDRSRQSIERSSTSR